MIFLGSKVLWKSLINVQVVNVAETLFLVTKKQPWTSLIQDLRGGK